MKLGKKVLCFGMAALMGVSMTACSSAKDVITEVIPDETATLVYEQDGVTITYTMEAQVDIVHTLTQVSTMDLSLYTEEQIALVEESLVTYADVYAEYESVTHSYVIEEDKLEETIVIDVSDSEELAKLSESGLLPIEGDAQFISMEKTIESLVSQGWTLQE